MVAFLVQCSSQRKPVPTNQPLSTFGHLHLSKATNSRNNPIPANAVEAKKQVRPPSAITLGYVRTFIRAGIFIGRRSVLNQFIGSKSIDLDFVFFVFDCKQRCRNWSLKVRWTKILNLPSTNTHDLRQEKKHMIWAMVTPYDTRIAKWMRFVENWLKMQSHFLLTWNWKPFIWIFYRCRIYVYMLVGSISFVY